MRDSPMAPKLGEKTFLMVTAFGRSRSERANSAPFPARKRGCVGTGSCAAPCRLAKGWGGCITCFAASRLVLAVVFTGGLGRMAVLVPVMGCDLNVFLFFLFQNLLFSCWYS